MIPNGLAKKALKILVFWLEEKITEDKRQKEGEFSYCLFNSYKSMSLNDILCSDLPVVTLYFQLYRSVSAFLATTDIPDLDKHPVKRRLIEEKYDACARRYYLRKRSTTIIQWSPRTTKYRMTYGHIPPALDDTDLVKVLIERSIEENEGADEQIMKPGMIVYHTFGRQ